MAATSTFVFSFDIPFLDKVFGVVCSLPTSEFCEIAVLTNLSVSFVLLERGGMDLADVTKRLIAGLQEQHVSSASLSQLSFEHVKCHSPSSKFFGSLLEEINQGLVEGIMPELCEEGVGGTYFMKSASGAKVGVFKPADEEPAAANNPKSVVTKSSLPGDVPPEEGCLREYAAYLLDRDGFAGVPATGLAEVFFPVEWKGPSSPSADSQSPASPKFGSIQQFVPHSCNSEEIGYGKFSQEQVQHIALLDVRMLNTDRHGGNILVVQENEKDIRLVPIDHAMCLPESLPSQLWFEWMNWAQSRAPISPATVQYINNLDADEDCKVLMDIGVGAKGRVSLRIGTLLLKMACKYQLSFNQLGQFICDPDGLNKLVDKFDVYNVKSNSDCLPSKFDDEVEIALSSFSSSS